MAYCTVITAFTLWARDSVQRHNSSAAPDTMLLGQLQRGRPTHQRADKPSAFESPGAVLQEQSSFGSQWRRLHPLSPSVPCYIWIFPPCSSNSGPRINVAKDTVLKHHYYGLRYSTWVMLSFKRKRDPPPNTNQPRDIRLCLPPVMAHIQFP